MSPAWRRTFKDGCPRSPGGFRPGYSIRRAGALPETPEFFDVSPGQIRLKIVFGRRDAMAEELAKSSGFEIEHYEPDWLKEAKIARAEGPI